MLQCDSRRLQESHGKPKGGASQQSCRPTKTESCLNTYFHWEGGRGSSASFNQDLKTGEPLIKTLRCTFILFLWRLCWLMSSALILLFWSSVSDVSLLQITPWSSCDVEKEKTKSLDPTFPLHHHIQVHECVWYVVPPTFFFFFLLYGNSAINFLSAVINITSWLKRSCDRVLPHNVRGQQYLTWTCSWWWGQTLQQASWQMSCLSALE